MTPPRLAERLLAATVRDADWRDSILGDLREEMIMVRNDSTERAARRWYWRQALAIGARTLASRLGVRRSSFPGLAGTAELETRGGWWMGFTRDLRHAWRTIWRRPATSAVIVFTLALALATTSASYAILDALVLRPFRFPGSERLVVLASSDPQQGLFDRESVAPADFRDWRDGTRTITGMSAMAWWDASLSGIEIPERIPGFRVSSDFFTLLGADPILGRSFTREEETPGNHRRAILGHGLWTRLFNADPGVIGRTVRLDGEPYEVVGVAPPNFAIPDGSQIWAPLAYSADDWRNRRGSFLQAIGRLRDGVTIAQARADIGGIAERLRREYPETNESRPFAVVRFNEGMADPGAGPFVSTMLAASVLLLLIACANIANLLLARGAERSQEFAMRLALGAGRLRLTWQLMIEALLLAGAAIAVAMPIAWGLLALSRRSIPPPIVRFIPGFHYMDLSPAVFWMTAAFAALATLVFALLPALQTVKKDVAEALRQGTRATTAPRQRQWLRNTLAAAQVAITLALLFGSGLLVSAARNATDGAFGFDKRNVLIARLVLPDQPYAEAEKRRQFIDGVLQRLRAIPAVSEAAMVSSLPYSGNNSSREFYPDGKALEARDVRRVDYRRMTPDYLEAMRIPLLAGRPLTDADRLGTLDVALVSQRLVDRYWPDVDPIGRTFKVGADGPTITVVGVVGDVLHDWFQQLRSPTVYRPMAQEPPTSVVFAVRTVGPPANIASDLRQAVRAMDPDQPIISLQSMEDQIAERSAGITFIAGALGVVAAIALALAVMGLYSLMAFMVSRRRQELGVRLALGATRGQVIGLTTRQGLRVALAGLAIGAAIAYALGRTMESILYGMVAASLWQLLALSALLAGVALLASYLPARRIAQLDPTTALRAE